ncbi:MAG: hypothetical protein Fur0037_24660 [Planctomycetota bacterium]
MRLSKSARYALAAALEMATSSEPVTVSGVASRHAIPEGALAKVFQVLVRAGLAQGTRGVGGGYRLLRDASDISVLEIVELFDPPARKEGRLDPRLRRLFEEVEEVTRSTYASVSLETLAR